MTILVGASARGLGNRRSLVQRVRFQLSGGLLLAILLPALIRMAFVPHIIFSSNLQTTILASMTAHTLGFFAYRRIGTFPGVAAAGMILPTFGISYGVVFATVLFFRLDYSRYQILICFGLSILWYFGLALASRRMSPQTLAVVPGGAVDQLMLISGVNWRRLASADNYPGQIHGVVADLRSDLSDDWERFIADCALAGIPVYHVKHVTESLTGRVQIEHLSENTLGSLNPNQAYIKLKQMADWVLALIVFVLACPFLMAIGLAIRLDSEGPALFRQQRMGYRGQPFTVWKFRTMQVGSGNAEGRDVAITSDDDGRITRLGRFLRRTRLDELPQLINILRGEMSWIGPRPEAMTLSEWYQAELPFYRYRHIVRPGITGWAQVNQGHVAAVAEVHEKLHFDFYYIKNFSPWLDLLIVLRTVKTVLTGFGAR